MASMIPQSITTTLPAAFVGRAAAAAQDFEANALGQMLQPMFDTVDLSTTPFGGGEAEQSWKPMMVQEMAKSIARAGGVGIAAPVLQEMLRMQELHDANGKGRRG